MIRGPDGRLKGHFGKDGLKLILEPDGLYLDSKPLLKEETIGYINGLIEKKKVQRIYLFVREGAKFGDVMHAIDILSQSNAKYLGIAPKEIEIGATLK